MLRVYWQQGTYNVHIWVNMYTSMCVYVLRGCLSKDSCLMCLVPFLFACCGFSGRGRGLGLRIFFDA